MTTVVNGAIKSLLNSAVVSLSLVLVSATSFAADDNDVSEHVEHVFSEWMTTIDPTCTEPGEAERYCTECWYTETKEIPALGGDHSCTEWYTIEEPTCSDSGYAEGYCDKCGAMLYKMIPCAPHLWSNWDIGYYYGANSAFRFCYECGEEDWKIAPQIVLIIRNTISNSAKRTCDVIWNDYFPDDQKFQMAWRQRNGEWSFKNVRTKRGQISGLKIGGLYEIKVRPYIDLPDSSSDKLFDEWSACIYRYFHTTQKIRLASKRKGTFTMSWAKNPSATGYQILYTTNKNGSGAANNIVNIGANATSVTRSTIKVKGKTQPLKRGVTYYVQVREIRRVGGINYIGNISCPVAVKIK